MSHPSHILRIPSDVAPRVPMPVLREYWAQLDPSHGRLEQVTIHVEQHMGVDALAAVKCKDCFCVLYPIARPGCSGNWIPVAQPHDTKTCGCGALSDLRPRYAGAAAPLNLGEPPMTESQKRRARRQGELYDMLEFATTCLLIAPKCKQAYSSVLVQHAVSVLNTFDDVRVEQVRFEQTSQQRVLAARSGHRAFKRLASLAPEFLRSAAPLEGWQNKTHAGDVVGELIVQTAERESYSGSVDPARWSLTVQNLIRHDEHTGRAYEAHRSKRRSHRPRNRASCAPSRRKCAAAHRGGRGPNASELVS